MMSAYIETRTFEKLDLPRELRDLDGLIEADLRAVVTMITAQADARLMLTRREIHQLQNTLWNRLVGSINETVEPLTADAR
jgi:hypothetical protein